MTKYNPRWVYSLLSYPRATEAILKAGLREVENDLWNTYKVSLCDGATTKKCFNHDDASHPGQVVRRVGIVSWGPGKKCFCPNLEASERDIAAVMAGAYKLRDLRKMPRALKREASQRLKDLGFTYYAFIARPLGPDEAAEWYARRAVDEALKDTEILALTSEITPSESLHKAN